MTVSVMSGTLGDIFWDLPSWIIYVAGFDMGCTIKVANNTDTNKEYALMARLTREATVISEEVMPVFGYSWFTVEAGDFVELDGALRFTDSNADLTISLIERESGEATDSVTTALVAPSTSQTSVLPPAWPGTGSTGSSTGSFDWSSILSWMLPMVMFGVLMVTVLKPKQEKGVLPEGSKV